MDNKPGYILVLTLMIISALLVIATQLFYTGGTFSAYATYAYKREQAHWLALTGIGFAQSQLFMPAPKKPEAPAPGQQSKQQVQTEEPDLEQIKLALKSILPVLNHWQTITLTHIDDGVDGTVSFYIASEDGKLPINSILTTISDAAKTKKPLSPELTNFFDELWHDIAQGLTLQQKLGAGLVNFLEKRHWILLNDVTELLDEPVFVPFKNYVFVEKKPATKKPVPYLTDLFTVHTQYAKLDPWVLSASVRAVFGLQAPGELKMSEPDAAALAAKAQKTQRWETDWNTVLKQCYGKEFGAVPKSLKLLLNNGPLLHTFSVLSQATVGGVTQRMYCILKRRSLADHSFYFTPISTYLC